MAFHGSLSVAAIIAVAVNTDGRREIIGLTVGPSVYRPCFNDPMAGNFMLGDDSSIMPVDYEYASMNDRCYDLGIWFGEIFFTPNRKSS